MTLPVVFTANGQAGYNLTKSLRFRSSASAYLNRTPSVAATSTTKGTISIWFKGIGQANQYLVGKNSGTIFYLYFNSSNQLVWQNGGVNTFITTQVFRDPSSWYHLVASWDTTQATSSNRQSLYLNGQQITAFGTTNNLGLNATVSWFDNDGNNRGIGTYISGGYFDGYMAEINAIDGQALTPSSFGETSTTTGVWIPKKYTGTYGTNGFYLPFTNTTSTSTLGNDFSGNSNTWTVNNISLTSGSTYDSMNDVPTLTSATTANYAVLNPLAKAFSNGGSGTTSNGNLTITYSATNWYGHKSTIAVSSGKWYYEVTNTTGTNFVMCGISLVTVAAETNAGVYRYRSTGEKINTSYTSYGATWSTAGDICGIAFDLDAGTITFYKNGVSQGTAFTGIPAGEYAAEVIVESGPTTANVNFGQQPFAYTPPTGFVALNTFNLPTPTIGATASSQANKYFNAITYTGNGAASSNTTQNITTTFYPDLTWVKGRDSAFFHRLTSTGLTQPNYLSTNSTDAEGSVNDTISALASTYFQVKAAGTGGTNQSGSTYVGWTWNANSGSTVSNTAGSITSTVSANTTAGFSIVTYTGTGSVATIGHGLGVAPSMVFYKRRNATDSWIVYNFNIGAANSLTLNNSNGQAGSGSFYWNTTAPTSTVFSTGTDSAVNANGSTYVAYCFAPVAGYSAFGSYTGNGSTDGTFVYTGFRPRYIVIKRSSGIEDWRVFDTARSTYNIQGATLYPNISDAENSSQLIDINSNGFKCRTTDVAVNSSGSTYIYMAFAEFPFRYSLAR